MNKNLIVKCSQCLYEDIPENFNAFLSYGPNNHIGEAGSIILITLECPVCNAQQFTQHFKLGGELSCSNLNVIKYTFSHKTHPHEVAGMSPNERDKSIENNVKELRKLYSINLQKE